MRVVVTNRDRSNLSIAILKSVICCIEISKRRNPIDHLHIEKNVSVKVGDTGFPLAVSAACAGCVDVLVSDRLGVICEHVQAADIKDLIKLCGSSLILWARNGGGQLGTSRLIGEVRLLRSSQVRGGGDGANSRQTSRSSQLKAGAEYSSHCVNLEGGF